MSAFSRVHPLIYVVGPTGVGKSKLALEFALEHHCSILNCDSLQTYQGLDIGTAKPPPGERTLVPHHLFDVVAVGQILTAGDFRNLALEVLSQEIPKGPVLAVGGSGFYIQALEKGMFKIDKLDPKLEAELRHKLDGMTASEAFALLRERDPETAEALSPNDSYRIHRALLVVLGLGKRLSDLKKEFRPERLPYPQIKLGLTLAKENLRRRIEDRTRAMLDSGLQDEVRALVKLNLENWPLLQSVGYKQVLMNLRGQLPANQLFDEIVLRTVQLAKRQMTWFQRDKEIRWFYSEKLDEAKSWLASELDTVIRPRK